MAAVLESCCTIAHNIRIANAQPLITKFGYSPSEVEVTFALYRVVSSFIEPCLRISYRYIQSH
jgi:hypothetical protein